MAEVVNSVMLKKTLGPKAKALSLDSQQTISVTLFSKMQLQQVRSTDNASVDLDRKPDYVHTEDILPNFEKIYKAVKHGDESEINFAISTKLNQSQTFIKGVTKFDGKETTVILVNIKIKETVRTDEFVFVRYEGPITQTFEPAKLLEIKAESLEH